MYKWIFMLMLPYIHTARKKNMHIPKHQQDYNIIKVYLSSRCASILYHNPILYLMRFIKRRKGKSEEVVKKGGYPLWLPSKITILDYISKRLVNQHGYQVNVPSSVTMDCYPRWLPIMDTMVGYPKWLLY